jgi:hypothetical protein
MVQMVHTLAGEIPEPDLESVVIEEDHGDTITSAREWKYVGKNAALSEHVNKVVRRDVWVIIKTGFSAAGTAEL